jgi:flavin-binding protein dodecin
MQNKKTIAKSSKSLENRESASIKDQSATEFEGRVSEYKVILKVIF